MSWLDAVPPSVRATLIAASVFLLGSATVGLGRLDVGADVQDLLAATIVAMTAAAWCAVWWRFGSAGSGSALAFGEQQERRDGAVATWRPDTLHPLDVLAADPRFSFPVWAGAIRALAGPGPYACPRLIDAVPEGAHIRTRVAVREPGRLRILTVLVPARVGTGAPSLIDDTVVADTPDPPPTVDPGWPAARRALIARDGAFDVAGFEAQAREISVALDAGDDAARPYLTDDGALDLAYWRIVGLPDGGEDVEWLEIEQDGVYDRVELRVGGRVLSLRRPAARTEAPWELWRLRSAT